MSCQNVYAQAPGTGTTSMRTSGLPGDGFVQKHCMCLRCFCFWIVVVAAVLLVMHSRRK
jgi:hypothetical protein